ncbi:MAG: response regulator [Candidatus Omnitrophota bacterium]|jgi:CheY-like chemotaxis protein|nr:MAG: response regulator [Candidatus Omnitrophota bacterium]
MSTRILVVEDNQDSRELLVDALEFADYTVIQAADGLEGETKAKSEQPDLILLDISLPVKAGWDVAAALREDEITKNIPIIALTAHARQEDKERALNAGCTSYLPKPVKPRDVLKEIDRLLHS